MRKVRYYFYNFFEKNIEVKLKPNIVQKIFPLNVCMHLLFHIKYKAVSVTVSRMKILINSIQKDYKS